LKPFERKAFFQAEREKLHLQAERGDLVPSIDVEQRYASRNKLIDLALETGADVLERDVGLTPAQAARLEKHLDELRMTLYRILVDDDADSAVQDSA
jgi:2-keto-4-pentenoate hydratase